MTEQTDTENNINEELRNLESLESDAVIVAPEADPEVLNFSFKDYTEDKPSLVGKVFVGLYVGIFGWFVIHSLVYFWDLLIPWHITWLQYGMYYGLYLIGLVLALFLCLSFVAIWLIPSCSSADSLRFHIRSIGTAMLQSLYFSNLLGEPLPKIGSSWIGDDLRYPAFLSDNTFYYKFMFFISDTGGIFGSSEDGTGSTHLFRPFWNSRLLLNDKSVKYEENLRGILALAYIYLSYWFIFFAVAESYIELVLIFCAIYLARSSFGIPVSFFRDKSSFKLVFVVVYVIIRAYFAYEEWLAQESILFLACNVIFCLSHLTIFAGWYSAPTSKLGAFFAPFKIVFENKED